MSDEAIAYGIIGTILLVAVGSLLYGIYIGIIELGKIILAMTSADWASVFGAIFGVVIVVVCIYAVKLVFWRSKVKAAAQYGTVVNRQLHYTCATCGAPAVSGDLQPWRCRYCGGTICKRCAIESICRTCYAKIDNEALLSMNKVDRVFSRLSIGSIYLGMFGLFSPIVFFAFAVPTGFMIPLEVSFFMMYFPFVFALPARACGEAVIQLRLRAIGKKIA